MAHNGFVGRGTASYYRHMVHYGAVYVIGISTS